MALLYKAPKRFKIKNTLKAPILDSVKEARSYAAAKAIVDKKESASSAYKRGGKMKGC